MKIKVLGSGAWEGIPAPFCNCNICNKAKEDVKGKDNRTRPQLLVTNESEGFFVEASPDIRLQSGNIGSAEYTDFLISHSHHDHMTGLRDLHSWTKKTSKKPTIYCSSDTDELIKKELSYLPINTVVVKPFKYFIVGGIKVTPLPVYHVFTQEDNLAENQLQNTFAFLFEFGDKKFAYLADYYRMPDSTLDKIKNLDGVLVDGTYLFTDSFKEIKLNHLHGKDVIDFANSLNAKKIYYHSISHLTEMNHDKFQSLLPFDHKITYDGLEIQ